MFIKAILDTEASALLFVCVGRCFTAVVLLTHRVTSVEKGPCSPVGAVTQQPLEVLAVCPSPECRCPAVSAARSPQPVPTGRRPHLLSTRGTKQAPCSPHRRSHFRRAEAATAAGPPSHPRPPSQLRHPRGLRGGGQGRPLPHGLHRPSPRKGQEPAAWEGLVRTFPAPPCCTPRSRTAPSAPSCADPEGSAAPLPKPAALPPWRGRPAAGAGRSRRHSRCQRRYILPEPLPPPSSRHAGLAGLGLSVTERRPGAGRG